jgi:hypothetical protein
MNGFAFINAAAFAATFSLTAASTAQASTYLNGMNMQGTSAQGMTMQGTSMQGNSVGGQVFLHRFLVKDDSGKLTNLCAPDAQGKSLGFPVPDGRGGFDLTCTSGVPKSY